MKILGVDPGGTTGYFLANFLNQKDVELIRMEAVSEGKFFQWVDLLGMPPLEFDIMALEDFIARPSFTDGRWTELPVAKQIGALQYRCHQLGKPCVMQQPIIKPTGYALLGMKYVKGKKNMHMQDAAAHAYFLHRKGYTKEQLA